MKNVMIDFETFGLHEDAVLLSLGAVALNEDGEIVNQFYSVIDPRTQPGRITDPGTVLWWFEQDQAARDAITEAVALTDSLQSDREMTDKEIDHAYEHGAHDLRVVAQAFSAWYLDLGEVEACYSCGAVDHAWMSSMMRMAGLQNPVKYYKQADYRTLRNLMPTIEAPEFEGTKHNALADATHQAKHLALLLNALPAVVPEPAPEEPKGE